jgi:hypothetical protein
LNSTEEAKVGYLELSPGELLERGNPDKMEVNLNFNLEGRGIPAVTSEIQLTPHAVTLLPPSVIERGK